MQNRFTQLPKFLMEHSRMVRLAGPFGDIPVLLAHPDWVHPAPTVLWMHGRTANKELDPGRYQRWLRAGIAACAIDLPGHGERFDRSLNHPAGTLKVIEQMVREVDSIVESLSDPKYQGVFDLDRLGIGGMSAGGMATIVRLFGSVVETSHEFRCAAVEGTTGCISDLYSSGGAWEMRFDAELMARLDVCGRIGTNAVKPVPFLAIHAQEDEVVPLALQEKFVGLLRAAYQSAGAEESLVELATFPRTGAEREHNGFGKFSNDAKNRQTEFLAKWLKKSAPTA